MTDRFRAWYRLETAGSVHQVAESIAGEQSSGTFVPTPGETPTLKARHGARVESITEMDNAAGASLPGGPTGTPVRRAMIEVSFPFENVGTNLPTLFATVAGNLFELAGHSGLRLLDLEVPDEFADSYSGPQFGIEGTRRLADVYERPILGTIIKPSVGLSPEHTASMAAELIAAGLDFIKDDELMANPPHSPFAVRVTKVMEVVNAFADRTGRKPMVAFNVSGDMDEMRSHHDLVLASGGTCVMVSVNWVGFAGVAALRKHSQLPIHGHRNGWGMFTRHPLLGFEFRAYQKLWRVAGIDHLHVNGLRNKFWESDESVVRSIKDCFEPLYRRADRADRIMPVVSSGQWAGMAPDTFAVAGSADLLHLAGGGIAAHPDGPAAGVRSMIQGWEAAMSGVPLEIFARNHLELRRAMEHFGGGQSSR